MIKCTRVVINSKGDWERVKKVCAKNKRINRLISGFRLNDSQWLVVANLNTEDDTQIDIQENR